MARNIELLLLNTVENLGIVGDVVRVKSGYARNYLLPHGLAEPPTPAKIYALKEQRAKAQTELSAQRAVREQLVEQLADVTVTIERSCNDQGALYGSVTQRDVSDALQAAGYGVDVRFVRLGHAIRRIGEYPVPIQFDKELRAEATLFVKPDRELEDLAEPEASQDQADEPSAETDPSEEKPPLRRKAKTTKAKA